jgi:hypothetical protein
MWQTLGCWQLQLRHPISTQLCCQRLLNSTTCITSKKLKGHKELMNFYSSIMFNFFFMDCTWISKKCALWQFFIMCSLGIFVHEMVSKLLLMKTCWIFRLHSAVEFFFSWSALGFFLLHEMPFSFCPYFNNFNFSKKILQVFAYVCFNCFKVVCAHQIIAKGT